MNNDTDTMMIVGLGIALGSVVVLIIFGRMLPWLLER